MNWRRELNDHMRRMREQAHADCCGDESVYEGLARLYELARQQAKED